MGNVEYKQEHRERGLCTDCSEPVYRGLSRCLKHLRSHVKADNLYERTTSKRDYKQRREERKDQGRCVKCGVKLDPDADCEKVCCMNCRDHLWIERKIHGTSIV